ncbi:hypothetical protein [Corynebacterium tuberculostearicum]|uniref:hypothetical protein n=1 Tax=Corynebacterium tuberculostearicum TaxID=38304 RepID=UPI00265CB0F3|nr:hypothetical protein [Corynebacterium tuberculostearicum]WKE58579.1 hypothetical protein J8247_11910 [Corynebacterium tuberculostearicum]
MTNNLGKNFANRALKKNNGTTTQRATTRARSKQTVSDEDNYLLKTTRKIKTDDFIDVGGTKNTTVKVPQELHATMLKIKEQTGIGLGAQLLNALRTDPESGAIGNLTYDRPRRGPGSAFEGHSVFLRVPVEEYMAIRELAYNQNLPISQLFLNAWRRQNNS